MIVVGGTYFETCERPGSRVMFGSGLRAAGAISLVAQNLTLYTAVDDEFKMTAHSAAAALGVNTFWVKRSEPIAFRYYTPLSSPSIDGRTATCEEISATDELALVFGMIETRPKVECKKLVFDPQQPREIQSLKISSITYEELVIVANASETRVLGKDESVEQAAKNLLDSSQAIAVVTKCGAWGALVTTKEGQHVIGAHPTNLVSPIGTGDIFAAAFAWAWGQENKPAVESARIASAVVASWTQNRVLPIMEEAFRKQTSLQPPLKPRPVQVYLAGPYFTLGQQWLVDLARSAISGLGAKCFSPFHDVGPGGDEVAIADLEGLAKSDSVLALLDGNDGGTIFEAGWATKNQIPIVAYASNPLEETAKMLRGTGAELHTDLSTAVYRAIWAGLRERS